MEIKTALYDDPALVLERAGEFLASQPVLHNLILSLLHARVERREPGRYWVALDGEKPAGVVIQSPVTFPATFTPMDKRVTAAMVDAITEARISLPGAIGDAATAASF